MNLEEATIKALEGKLEEKVVRSENSGVCPVCGADAIDGDIDFGELQIDYDSESAVYYPFHCNKCGTDGREFYELSFLYMEADKDGLVENKKTNWRSYIKQWAKDSFSAGKPIDSDDFKEFKHIMKDDNFDLSEEEFKNAWEYYWDCYNEKLN